MSALDEMVSDIASAFTDAGFCDAGQYTPLATTENPTPDPIACRVYMDFGAQVMGENVSFAGPRVAATFLLSEVTPDRGGVLVVGGKTYRLEFPDVEFQSSADSRWIVLYVSP